VFAIGSMWLHSFRRLQYFTDAIACGKHRIIISMHLENLLGGKYFFA